MAPLGAVVVIGGAALVAGACYLIYKNNNGDTARREKPIEKLLSDDDRYDTDKTIILRAIEEEDWGTLEDLLDSSTKDFPDLIRIINNALKDRE